MASRRGRWAQAKASVVTIGAALTLAVGGAGLYAGTLTTTTSGQVGAGSTPLQSSCTDSAVVAPQVAIWNPITQHFEYHGVTVAGVLLACANQYATVAVYAISDGSVLSTNSTPHQITGLEATLGLFSITLDTPVNAALVDANYHYALIIQTATG